MEIVPWVNVAGDFVTLLGGVVLALDAINKEREFARHKAVDAVLGAKPMGGLVIDLKGVILKDSEDVTRVFIRQTARQAVWGCSLLVLGFLLLLAAHIAEVLKAKG